MKLQYPKDIWAFMEIDSAGHLRRIGAELLTAGRELTKKSGGMLSAVVLGNHLTGALREISFYGADQVIYVDSPFFTVYSLEHRADAICKLIKKYRPKAMLFGATAIGRDLASMVAAQTGAPLIAECSEVRAFSTMGKLAWTREAFGGYLSSEIETITENTVIGTIRTGAYPRMGRLSETAPILSEDFFPNGVTSAAFLLDIVQSENGNGPDLENADVIVSGGRGVGGPEGFRLVTELAEVLGGAVGASRVAVDKGWISREHLIGQSGKTVKPKLYVACGISGSVQHITGMRNADCIFAIDTDPKSLIFNIADYGIVGDLRDVIPCLIHSIKKIRAG